MVVSCHVGSRDWNQVVRLGGRCFDSLNYLTNLSPNISYVHTGLLGPPCLNSPWTNCLALYTQDHSSHPCSWGQQQISCHFHHLLHTGGLFLLTDFFLMPPDYFLVFITFFLPAFMLTCSLIQLTSSVSSSYLLLITVQNMSTFSSVMGLVISVRGCLSDSVCLSDVELGTWLGQYPGGNADHSGWQLEMVFVFRQCYRTTSPQRLPARSTLWT